MVKNIDVDKDQLILRIYLGSTGQDVGAGGKHILVACLPKSGSTFLSSVLSRLPKFEKVNLTFGFDRREQELCLLSCAGYHAVNYVAQHHVRYSEPTLSILRSFHIFPVILTRNVYDCVVSLRDHMLQNTEPAPLSYVPADFSNWDDQRQYDFVIDLALPWYANFLACWSDYRGPGVRISYEDLTRNPHESVTKIAQAAGVETTWSAIDEAISGLSPEASRFNVGRMGRGAEHLSEEQIFRIQRLFSAYSHIDAVQQVLALPKLDFAGQS